MTLNFKQYSFLTVAHTTCILRFPCVHWLKKSNIASLLSSIQTNITRWLRDDFCAFIQDDYSNKICLFAIFYINRLFIKKIWQNRVRNADRSLLSCPNTGLYLTPYLKTATILNDMHRRVRSICTVLQLQHTLPDGWLILGYRHNSLSLD